MVTRQSDAIIHSSMFDTNPFTTTFTSPCRNNQCYATPPRRFVFIPSSFDSSNLHPSNFYPTPPPFFWPSSCHARILKVYTAKVTKPFTPPPASQDSSIPSSFHALIFTHPSKTSILNPSSLDLSNFMPAMPIPPVLITSKLCPPVLWEGTMGAEDTVQGLG